MRRITGIVTDGSGTPADSICLDHDLRCRRRMVFTTRSGQSILLDQSRPVHLRDGDRMLLDDGTLVHVEAAAEALIEITAADLPALVRIAWHLGNRHLPTQLLEGRLRIRHDHVIAEMVAGLGGACEAIMAPFDPEGGAYAGEVVVQGHDSGHSHGHGHYHHHGHNHG